MTCPTCSYGNRVEALYCGMCGTRLTQICLSCGYANPRDYRFCIRCGTQLVSEAGLLLTSEQAASSAVAPGIPAHEPARAPAAPAANLETASRNRPQLEGERRVATIIMADVQSSTDLMGELGTEAWVELMNRIFQIMEAEIYRLDGRVDQFRGDGLVAAFGTVVAHEDDPERGVLAALAMQRAVSAYAAELRELDGTSLSLRVGVNTGEVIVAIVGDDRTYSEDTAMGEAIALAARMEQAAEAGTVLVSENTYNLVQHQFDWLPLGEIMVKGINHPVNVYRPLASRFSSERRDFELTPALIGRERELAQLLDAVDDLHVGRGGIVMVTGERGMGKSLLLQEMRRDVARQEALRAEVQSVEGAGLAGLDLDDLPEDAVALALGTVHTREIRGRARSYDQSQPYAVWQDMVRDWLGARQDEPKERTRDRLREEAEKLWGEDHLKYYPHFARFLELPLEPALLDQVQQLDAESSRQRLFLAVRSWIEQLAHRGPLMLTFNDIHWADTTSLDLLRYCLPLCDYLDLLWLLVFRPDRLSSIWEFRHYVETEYPHRLVTVTLPPFTTSQSETLIEQMIGPGALPAETLAAIIQKSDGNPFFTQELVRSLIANGRLVREVEVGPEGEPVERWRATEAVTEVGLPDSLQGLLMARIDRLGAAEQDILQRAAVIGCIFWSKVLEAISPDRPDLRTLLTALQRAQLISERGRGPDLGIEYIFQSKLICDAAYDSLLGSQRAAYHHRIAQYLERQYERDPAAQDQGFFYGELAYHYQHARQPDKELVYTLKNADRAKDIYANAEASQHYTHALQLLQQLCEDVKDEEVHNRLRSQCFQVLMNRRQVYHLMGEYAKMRADAQALLPMARELPNEPRLLIDALLNQPGVGDYQSAEDTQNGVAMAEEALALSRHLGDRRRELESLLALANQRLVFSDPAWHEIAEQALTLARELGDRTYEARILVGMGSIFAFSDEPELSMEFLEAAAALAMSEGLEDKLIQMSLLNLLGLEYERSGDYHRLLVDYQQERLHASREIGHRPMQSQALQAVGRITAIYLGDYAAGLGALEECRRILRNSPGEVYPLFHIAQIQVAQAEHDAAHESLQQVASIGEPVQDRARASLKLVELSLRTAEGARAATKGDTDAVITALTAALELASHVVDIAEHSPLVSQQYEMAARCKAVTAHLGLAGVAQDPAQEASQLEAALKAAERAYEILQHFGFAQVVEVTSEEVLFRYSQALAANQQQEVAVRFLRRAYDEMMRKYALIPAESHFRRTYLEQIPLHREIRAAYATRVGSILTEAVQPWYQTEPTLS
jgi:predicted ATPase/class 3 adenylate cyclase